MARVAVILKVYPNSIELDLGELKKRIEAALPEGYKIEGSGEEPIAFGLKALKLIISMPEEKEGGTEELESMIRGVDGIEEVEIEAVHRLS
ncbi:MAG: elongation factor 1-beta [Desulfurococcales archaeon]|nr:elongation factor 1-beta [Desulfurococcales archaeon]